MTQQLAQDSASGTSGDASTIPDAVVAVYATEADLTAAIKHLERAVTGEPVQGASA